MNNYKFWEKYLSDLRVKLNDLLKENPKRKIVIFSTFADTAEYVKGKLEKDGFKVLKLIATLFKEYKPFFFFNIVAILLAIISLIFVVPVFQEYFRTGLVLKFPTLIVGGFIMVAAILSFICGVILDVIVKKHKQLYELMLNQLKKEE